VDKLALQNEKEIQRELLAYLGRYPEAHDTLEGIVEWWLLEQHIQKSSLVVKEALSALISKGIVTEIRFPDGRIHYCLRATGGSGSNK